MNLTTVVADLRHRIKQEELVNACARFCHFTCNKYL